MAERSIVAKVRAEVSGFVSNMGRAAKAAKGLGDATEQTQKRGAGAFSRLAESAKKNEKAWNEVGNASLVAGGAIAAGLGYGIKSFADFDEAMSGVAAALPDAGAKMDDLRQLAIKLGADSQYSAAEAAQGITELGKAGVSAGAIMAGGLKGALDLAAAGQMSVADAAETAASALVQFKLKGSDVPHVADLLAAGAGKAQGSVKDLGMALAQAGLVASATGLTIEETTGGLAAFASAGLVGSDAGTSMKTMLQRLTPQSKDAQKALDALGISAYDSSGNFIGLAAYAGKLRDGMRDLSPQARSAAMSVIFGSDAVRAANVLYEQGASGIQKWIDEVNDAGYAAKQAAALTDNWKGDLERLGGAFDSVFVSNGGSANAVLRTLTQHAQEAVEWFGRLPGPVQQGAFGVAALAAAALLAFGAFSKLMSTGASLVESMNTLGLDSAKATKGMQGLTSAVRGLGVATLVIAGTAAAIKALQSVTDGDMGARGVDTLTRKLTNASTTAKGLDDVFNTVGTRLNGSSQLITNFGDALEIAFNPGPIRQFEDAVGGMFGATTDVSVATDRFKEMDSVLTALVNSGQANKAAAQFTEMTRQAKEHGVSVDQLKAKLPEYTNALDAAANEQDAASKSGRDFASILDEGAKSAEEAKKEIDNLSKALKGLGSAAMDADEAQASYIQSSIDTAAAVAKNGAAVNKARTELDLNSEAGRKNQKALQDLAQQTISNTAAAYDSGAAADVVTAKMATGRAAFIASARAAGLTADAAEALATKYGLVPSEVDTMIRETGTAAAGAAVDGYTAKLNSVPRSVQSTIALQVGGLGTLEYAKSLVQQMNGMTATATVKTRYTVEGHGGGGSTINADGGIHERRGNSLVRAFADGGTLGSAQPQIRRAGGAGVLWAEDGAGPWESFISGHPRKRARSVAIWRQTGQRLGADPAAVAAVRFADGGFLGRGGAGVAGLSPAQLARVFASVVAPAVEAGAFRGTSGRERTTALRGAVL